MTTGRTKQILCIWLPNWPIQRVLAAEPALVGRAVILETRDARGGLLVAAANLAARRAGARVGMRMSELAALKPADETTNWDVRAYDAAADLDALCELVEQAQQFSPVVGLEQLQAQPWHGRHHLQPQAILLDATGIANLFGDEAAYLAEVGQWLRTQRYFGYMALASTVGAAWALANYEVLQRVKDEPAIETPGVALSKPDAEPIDLQTYVPASRSVIAEAWEEAELLSNLPIGCLRVETETVDKLRRLGVGTLNQLWQLPRDGLASRLGTELMHRSDQALGLAEEAVIALHAAPDWTCEFSLEHPTLSLEILSAALDQLCHDLGGRLNRAGQGTLRCLCRLDVVRRPPLLMQLGLFRACDDAAHLHRLLCGQLEQILEEANADEGDALNRQPVRQRPKTARPGVKPVGPTAVDEEGTVWRISLQATMIGPMVWQQTQLFDQSEQRTKQHLAALIDTLSSRLGRDGVLEARVERDAEPDQAVTYQPLTGRRLDGQPQQTSRKLNSRLATHSAEPRPTDPLRRPVHLITPPGMLAAVQLDSDQRLAEFVFNQRRVRAVTHWGPERLESGWWRGPSMRRDYYRIETTDGTWWWIYRDLATGHWFVHGMFG